MIEIYTTNIKQSLKNKCYFSALALALTLPDMCGMAEYPKELSVAKRYIAWYDNYIGCYMKNEDVGQKAPWLSGEVIYNMRNTFLHQGSPSVIGDKVKEADNQLDDFILLLGDGTVIQQAAYSFDVGYGEVIDRKILVDVTYLCDSLCDAALWYYKNNIDKFEFKFSFITQEEFISPVTVDNSDDIVAKILNKKLEDSGSTKRIIENPEHNLLKSIREELHFIFANDKTRKIFLSGESTITLTIPASVSPQLEKSGKTMSKRESQIRSFFGKHFKKKIYVEKKEEIILSVLEANTRQQVNNNLMKFFKSEEVKVIYERLQPLLKEMPER